MASSGTTAPSGLQALQFGQIRTVRPMATDLVMSNAAIVKNVANKINQALQTAVDRDWIESLRTGGQDVAAFDPATYLIGPDLWPDLTRWWMEDAANAGIDLSAFDPAASLEDRLAWCRQNDIKIACGYGRFSSKLQKSDFDQARAIVKAAATKRYYLPPEYISIDRARTGRANRRPGLDRNTFLISQKLVSGMVFFSTSRVYRRAYDSHKYINEKVFSKGVRAFAASGTFDTALPGWKIVLAVMGIVDEQQIEATSAAVRNRLIGLFLAGFLLGPAPVGYISVDDPGGAVTNQGAPRQRQAIHRRSADLVAKHFEWIAGGMKYAKGRRLWNQEIADWPEEDRRHAVDARSTMGRMSPEAYRRMFQRNDYRGLMTFCETMSEWQVEKDYNKQIKNEGEVPSYRNEDLRIVSDELWARVQERIARLTRGKHGPRRGGEAPFSALMSQLLRCGKCKHVFHSYGSYMHCPESTRGECDSRGTVNPKVALAVVVAAIRSQILASPMLVDEIVALSIEIDARDDGDGLSERIAERFRAAKRAETLMAQILEGAGDKGMTDSEKKTYQALRVDYTRETAEGEALKNRQRQARVPITREEVVRVLAKFDTLLRDAGDGKLGGADDRDRAFELLKTLVGGGIEVFFDYLPNGRAIGRGRFKPMVMEALRQHGAINTAVEIDLAPVEVTFRDLPLYARHSDEIYRIRHEEGLTWRAIGKRVGLAEGNVIRAYAYWHESRGLPVPPKVRVKRKDRNQPSAA